MPSEFRNQKNLSEWIELDYYRRPRGLRRWKRPLAWGALILCVVGVGVVMILPGGSRTVQAGPLAAAHGMFNDDCSRCHEKAFQTVKKLAPWNAGIHVVSDQTCVHCHDGPPHHDRTVESPACASCHREHRGKLALTHVVDGHCVACHGELKEHRKGGDEGLRFQNVHAFTKDHPEFALFRDRERAKDPGQLHFNHKVHLKSEGILRGDGTREQLTCATCHKADPAGRYMEPIRYDNHCASCHPLSVRMADTLKAPEREQERLDRAVKRFNEQPAPHDRPEVVRAVMRERLLDFVQEFPLVAGIPENRLSDSKLLGRRGTQPPSEKEWTWTRERLGAVERLLFPERQKEVAEKLMFHDGGGCRFCHLEEKRSVSGVELGALPIYRPTQIPSRWLTHARFSHDKHRMLQCAECHKAEASEKTGDVLMPRLESCQQCHTPKTGVRHDCVECHSYHNRALKGEPRKGMTIGECLGR